MKRKDLISVIVPVYNVEKYLSNCLDSIINQTYKNLEIILIDDGSTDKSSNICDKYAKKDRRIKVIHKENGGLSDARNKGLDIASGKFISFVDSDDYINIHMIEDLYNAITINNTKIAMCKIKITKKTDENIKIKHMKLNNIILTDNEIYDRLYNGSQAEMTTACNKLYKKNIFNNIRYPIGESNEDDAILHLILDKTKKISYIDNTYYYYYQRNESIMHKKNPKAKKSVEHFITRGEYFLNKGMKKYYELNCYLICHYLARYHKDINEKSCYKKYIKKYSTIALQSKYCSLFKKCIIITIKINPNILKLLLTLKSII